MKSFSWTDIRPTIRLLLKRHLSRISDTYPAGRERGCPEYGIAQAEGEIIVTLDADGETPPEEINKFIRRF